MDLSKIISIGTAVPAFRHRQSDILQFMQRTYALEETDWRKLKFLYHHSGIDTRYSVIPDYSRPLQEWKFYPQTENIEPFPSLEQRMMAYQKYAAPLSVDAIRQCLEGKATTREITHLITVSCTGMSAPGLDLQLLDLLGLPKSTFRTSINFMGCYAAIHGLKMADLICKADPQARVLIVCTELCTLHFQREPSMDNIASSLLFADGSAAALVVPAGHPHKGVTLTHFYSEVVPKGRQDMAWELSSSGFLMTLSSYIPDLIEEDFEQLVLNALSKAGLTATGVQQWCIHPGGKKILDVITRQMKWPADTLQASYQVLKDYGNMSSPTILFVLRKLMQQTTNTDDTSRPLFGAAFGPGLTMETFIASY